MAIFSSPIYKCSPLWMQESLVSAYGGARKLLREDRQFRQLLREAEERQYWSADRLENWQRDQLKRLLRRALTVIPYYRKRVSVPNLDRFDPFEVLTRFPILRKPDVIAARNEFVAEDMPRHVRLSQSTSGTTGAPLSFYQTFESVKKENALVWRQLKWAGFRENGKRIWLRGDMIVPAARVTPPFWRMNRAENMLMMSAYHLSDKDATSYVDEIRRFDPQLIQAYPSAISFLANSLANRGMAAGLKSLRGIVTSSESLMREQQEKIEATFGVRVHDWFGSAERVAAVGTCEHGRHHIIPDAGYTEFVPNQHGLHEIVGTGFNNDLMPLIRYSTEDFVELEEPHVRCECGRAFPVVNRVIGRVDDTLKTPSGRVMGVVDHIYQKLSGIAEAQIVQERIDSLEIRVVPMGGEPLPTWVRDQLVTNLRERVGTELDISVVEVNSLPRTPTGKVRPIISKL